MICKHLDLSAVAAEAHEYRLVMQHNLHVVWHWSDIASNIMLEFARNVHS